MTPLGRDGLPHHNTTPAPQVEFEIRHTREHLGKLKFNWLELQTKRTFLARLSDADEWRACQSTRWTPGELKQLERACEPAKEALKEEKARTEALQRQLLGLCEQGLALEREIGDKQHALADLLGGYRRGRARADELAASVPSAPLRSAEEVQATLDEQSIALEKKTGTLERQRAAIADLERLLALHEGENQRLQAQREELTLRRQEQQARPVDAEERRLGDLCRWFRAMQEVLGRLTGCQVEMVNPEYLLVTIRVSAAVLIPVHVTVDAFTGRLREIKIGATSATPKRAWREIVEAALEYNDLPFLIRAITQQASGGGLSLGTV